MLLDVEVNALPFGYDANIRFNHFVSLNRLRTQHTVIKDVNVPENILWRMAEADIDLPLDPDALAFTNISYVKIGHASGSTIHTGSGFWVTDVSYPANKASVIRLHIRRDPMGDVSGYPWKGNFSAMPMRTNPNLKLNPGTWPVESIAIDNLPHIVDATTMTGAATKVFWVQIVTSRSLESGLDPEADDSGLFRYGVFVPQRYGKFVPDHHRVKLKDPTGTTVSLSMREVVNGLDEFLNKLNPSLQASDIIDVHVSERCPHVYEWSPTEGFSMSRSGADIVYTDPHGNRFGLWTVEELSQAGPESATVNMGDENLAALTGTATIIDSSGNEICEVPGGTRKVRITTYSDYTGIYTNIRIVERDETYVTDAEITFPEGHLPFVGDNWIAYQSQQRGYDRELMNINRDKALADTANSIGQVGGNAIMGFLMGGPIGAASTVGVGIAGTLIGTGINLSAEDRMQQAKEAQQRILSGTAFNAGYGFMYVINSLRHPAHIRYYACTIPYAEFLEYVKYHGYPAEGNKVIDRFTKGFWQGAVLCQMSTGSSRTPVESNYILKKILNEDLAVGFRFIESKDDI